MTDRFADSELTCDGFLGGALMIRQPRNGYRAGVDPVLLAASVPAKRGQTVLELGCGAGVAILSLGRRVSGLSLTGIELQPAYADLGRRNGVENQLGLTVYQADLTSLPDPVTQTQFDHVIANPPYYRPGAHSSANDKGRSIALGEATPLAQWIDVASRRLKPRGYLHMIQRTDRLQDMIAACPSSLGSIEVMPFSPRAGAEPGLIVLRARKSGRAAFRLHAPTVLHTGDHHAGDRESYRAEIAAALRHGAALPWAKASTN